MFGAKDDAIFQEFEQDELENPSPRKEVDGRFIYVSRQLNVPKRLGLPVLCDFGSVVSGEQLNIRDVQPDLYRAPEMLFEIPWRYEIDIWNAGIPLPSPRSLDEIETNLEGKDKELFLQFMRKMLQWAPEHRSSAKELLQDPRLKGQL